MTGPRALKAAGGRIRADRKTPVQNQLGDPVSIFDFINPGLLGTASSSRRYT